ncbi:MAG: hemerythrin family protein [Sulfurimonas sp.]|nr:hemerythrin family protein [Sulfurimonas sp.]MDQ7062442.1 hemerythrin family protein [Sulfurimonas sp.]
MLIEVNEIHKVTNDIMNVLHEEELQIINDFHDAVVAKDIDKIEELFTVLIENVEDHFKTEEDMMAQSTHSNFGAHKSDHDLMRKKLAKFKKRWDVLHGPIEVQGFLEKDFKKWVTAHVAKWDADCALQLQ